MKIETAPLKIALRKALSAVPAKTTMTILESFLLSFSGDLYITGSGETVAMTVKVPTSDPFNNPFSIAVPAKLLSDVVGSVKEDRIIFKYDPDKQVLTLQTETGVYSIPGIDPTDYPEFPKVEAEPFTVLGHEFRAMIDEVDEVVNKGAMRMAMQSVHINFKAGESVGTDGHRLLKYSFEPRELEAVNIPHYLCGIIKAAFNDNDAIEVMSNGRVIQLATSDTTLRGRLIDERYPDYNGVIPIETNDPFIVNRQSLLNAVNRVSLFTGNSVQPVIIIHFKNGKAVVSAENADTASRGEESFPLDSDNTRLDEIRVGYNAKYLVTTLQALHEDKAKFHIQTPTKAVVLKEENKLALIMPLRLSGV